MRAFLKCVAKSRPANRLPAVSAPLTMQAYATNRIGGAAAPATAVTPPTFQLRYHMQSPSLPLRTSLRPVYASSILIAALLALVSAVSLLNRARAYPGDALVRGFVPNDLVNLAIGLPILLGCVWLARRGSLLGLLCWPGALFFGLYNDLAYVFALPLNEVLLLHLALAALNIYTLIALVASIDATAVQRQLQGTVPARLGGGILAAFGLLFLLRAAGVLANAIATGAPLPAPELATNVVDFLTAPALVIGGVLLWQRKALGYAVAPGLLFQASMLFVGLIAFLLLQPVLTTAPFAAVDVLVVLVMGLVCFVPFGLFVRGIRAGHAA